MSKSLVLPIYKKVAALDSTDAAELGEERRKLQRANLIRAGIQTLSIVLMTVGLVKSSSQGDSDPA